MNEITVTAPAEISLDDIISRAATLEDLLLAGYTSERPEEKDAIIRAGYYLSKQLSEMLDRLQPAE